MPCMDDAGAPGGVGRRRIRPGMVILTRAPRAVKSFFGLSPVSLGAERAKSSPSPQAIFPTISFDFSDFAGKSGLDRPL